jgi:MYXO-CTERM domain-containing protein
MADFGPRDPWSDEQLQSTQAGPPDRAPWTLTLIVIALLALLLLGGYVLWRRGSEPETPTGSRDVAPRSQFGVAA